MKTYEEMTRDVLTRRDKELKIRGKRMKTALGITIPSVAAAGAIGIVALANTPTKYVHNAIADGEAEIGTISEEIASPHLPGEQLREDKIVFNEGAPGSVSADIYLNSNDFIEYTLDEINRYYGVRIDAFSDLHPDWKPKYNKLGIYREEGNDGVMAWCRTYWQQNKLYWKHGEKFVQVEVNFGSLPQHCCVVEGLDYDVSIINNVDVTLHHFVGEYPNGEPIDAYYARFMFNNSGFEITADNVTEEEFLEIVELYTDWESMALETQNNGLEIPL